MNLVWVEVFLKWTKALELSLSTKKKIHLINHSVQCVYQIQPLTRSIIRDSQFIQVSPKPFSLRTPQGWCSQHLLVVLSHFLCSSCITPRVETPGHIMCVSLSSPFPCNLSSSLSLSPLLQTHQAHTHCSLKKKTSLAALLSSGLLLYFISFAFVPGGQSYFFTPRKSCHWDGKTCFLAECHWKDSPQPREKIKYSFWWWHCSLSSTTGPPRSPHIRALTPGALLPQWDGASPPPYAAHGAFIHRTLASKDCCFSFFYIN